MRTSSSSGVECRLGRAQLRVARAGAVGVGIEVGAAGEADAVEAVDERGDRLGRQRREHDGQAAGALDRLQVGDAERHLGVRGSPCGAAWRARHAASRRW